MRQHPTHVTDGRGARYALGDLIGEGAQGQVFAVSGHDRLAVKLVTGRDPEGLRQQFAFVRHLPLEKLRVARPLELLQEPHLGYVMERLEGKTALRKLLYWRNDGTKAAMQIINSGGIKHRYYLLSDLASLIEEIHNHGLAYGDLSPDNVFVPLDRNRHDTHLIDADNLRSHTVHGSGIYTPRYGAPEVVRGEAGISTLTDAHAFAVLAFEVLCFLHPLIGAFVEQGEPELEVQALRGEFPWVDHPTDAHNRPADHQGVPRPYALTDPLRRLFALSFEEGLRDPQARPGMGEWRRALQQASSRVIECPECGRNALFDGPSWCPHTRPAVLLVSSVPWHPDFTEASPLPSPTESWVVPLNQIHTVTEEHARLTTHSTPLLKVSVSTKGNRSYIKVHNMSSKTIILRNASKGERELTVKGGPLGFALDDVEGYYTVHTGPLNRPHTAFVFTYFQEGTHVSH